MLASASHVLSELFAWARGWRGLSRSSGVGPYIDRAEIDDLQLGCGQTPGDVGPKPSRLLLHRVLGSSAWQVAADLSSSSLRVIEGFIVAVALGPSSLGALALVIAFVTTAFQLFDFRVWEVITRYVVEFR